LSVLENRVIWILSPQSWGKMFISKHHYAIALAARGNKVFFINPPNENLGNQKESVGEKKESFNLSIISHKLWFPYVIKFKLLPLFHFLMKFHLKRLQKKIGKPDIVWSFDIGHLYPMSSFDKSVLKIFHPVDEPLAKISISSANGAEIIFSVTNEILAKYNHLNIPKYFIHHGLSHEFLLNGEIRDYEFQKYKRVGFAGNLLRNDLDRPTFLTIIQQNPDVQFNLFGTYKSADSNISGRSDKETEHFISNLSTISNVILHGAVPANKLAQEFRNMDAFFICYDIEKDQSQGTNYHKIMEYISTGKVIISNNVTTFKDEPVLVKMIKERHSNAGLSSLFKATINDLKEQNSPDKQAYRINFARNNSYEKQVERISQILMTEGLGR
jgi:hypothetical protein